MSVFPVLLLLLGISWPAHGDDTARASSLRVERIAPGTAIRPLDDLQAIPASSVSLIRHALARGDRILPPATPIPGRILGAIGERQVIGQGDMIRIRHPAPLPVGTALDILRPGPMLTDPVDDQPLGQLVKRLGSARVQQSGPQVSLARVESSFQAIEPGDQLDLPHPVNADFTLRAQSPHPLSGRVIRIHDGRNEAAAHDLVIVGLGRRDHAFQGLTLPLLRDDRASHPPDPSPQPEIGQAILIQIGDRASLALLTRTHAPIRRGDIIRTP
ncbi:MAG: hypothetical protein HQL99_07535 [Magnetococcales bacterium]|nr:hypothetical protein [Magnetococcales bacterium]